MDLSYSTTNLFPVPIHIFDVNGFNEIKNQLIDYAYDLKKKDPEGVKISNRGGWQSSGFDIDDKDDILQSFLMNCLDGFPDIKDSVNFAIYAWVNINKNGDYNIKHDHPTNDLSGVVWIKCSENCGDIEFENPSVFQTFREINSYTDDFKNKNNIYQSYYFPPIEGRVLVFPSYLNHQVKENKSDEDRISVSFNIRLN